MAVAMLQQSSVRSVGRSQDLHPEEQALDIIPLSDGSVSYLRPAMGLN